VYLAFANPPVAIDLPATVVSSEGSVLRVCFENLTIEEQEVLTIALFSRADSWLGLDRCLQNDSVLHSLAHIFRISLRGMWATFRGIFSDRESPERKSTSLLIVRAAFILFLVAALAWAPAAIIEGNSPCGIASRHSIAAFNFKAAASFARNIENSAEAQLAHGSSEFVALFRHWQYDSGHGLQFAPFRIGPGAYPPGVLPWWAYLPLWFTQLPWLAAFMVIALALTVAFSIRQLLRARARARLTMTGY
jgi:hypothetical protein